MKRHLLVAAGLSAFAFAAAGAQDLTDPYCPRGNEGAVIPNSQRIAADACQQAYDVYQFLAPQLGLALTGGNAVIGQGSTLGGLGHFSVGVRINGFQGSIPQVRNYTQSTNGVQRNPALATKDSWVGLPTADAAIGLFRGIPLGLTNVGGVDLLVSASYVPTIDQDGVSVTPEQNFQLGYGARVGLISESIISPGVSLTYLKRDLPTTTIVGTAGSNQLRINDMKVATTAWRVVASKSFILFTLAAGGGKDRYEQSAGLLASVNGTFNGVPVSGSSSVPNGLTQELERTNVFLDGSLNLPLFRIVAEVGQVSGGAVQTYNGFSGGRADKSQQYFSIGLRIAR